MFTYDQQDPVQRQRVHELYLALHEESKKRGYGMYRAHVNHMGMSNGLSDPGCFCAGRVFSSDSQSSMTRSDCRFERL